MVTRDCAQELKRDAANTKMEGEDIKRKKATSMTGKNRKIDK